MLNRKKLVQLSLSEIPSETEYLDYKRQIDLRSTSGRGKLIRLICAMNNSNPNGQSFIFVGISDDKNIVGTSYLDDANFQNAIKGFIANAPKVSYENIHFKTLASNKFIGIITIYPSENENMKHDSSIGLCFQGLYIMGESLVFNQISSYFKISLWGKQN